MPVQEKLDQKQSRRITKSLSPRRTNPKADVLREKLHHSINYGSHENDTDTDLGSLSDFSHSNILKQLHSDFNKKYIGENVTRNSKLRWNRSLHSSPCQKAESELVNIFFNNVKHSPQIPSPIYSPIKPKNTKTVSEKFKKSPSISFETPPSSDESHSPKTPVTVKQRRKKINPKRSELKEKIQKSPLDDSIVKSRNLSLSKSKSPLNKIAKNKLKQNTIKLSRFTKKLKKCNSPKNIPKSKVEVMSSYITPDEDNSPIYFINEEHLLMENILDNESEKYELHTTPTSTISLGGIIGSTLSPSTSPIGEETSNLDISKDSMIISENEIENNQESLENISNENLFKRNFIELNKSKFKNSHSNSSLPNEIEIERVQTGSKSTEIEIFTEETPKQEMETHCTEKSRKEDEIIISENFQNANNISNEKSKSDNSMVQQDETDDSQNENTSNYKNIVVTDSRTTAIAKSDSLNYQLTHNRINELKSPLSNDSAQGSSIDVETNYHPKHYEIFWGRKGSFPYWPCLIWPDPEGKTLRIEKVGLRHSISYHVKFFADNGQRSWIPKDNLIAYNGREDFERRAKEQSTKMKNTLYKRYFVVTAAKLPIWNQAITEADKVLAVHIERRAEIFNEILGESMQKLKIQKRQRRMSLSAERNLLQISRNSINESTEDLLNTSGISSSISTISKRRRSSSVYGNLAKRHKIESNDNESLLSQQTLSTINTSSNKYIFPRDLIEILANYSLKTSENEELFERFEKCCIELFGIIKTSIHEENVKATHGKKHPNRVLRKNLINKLQKQYNEILSEPVPLNGGKMKKKRFIVDVPPIEIILKDIVDLLNDKNYLFRHLKKGPICKICLKPNDLYKCSGICDSWIHKDCVDYTQDEYWEKIKLESKKKRGKKINELPPPPKKQKTNSKHITGEDAENDQSLGRNDEVELEKQSQISTSIIVSSINEIDNSFENLTCKQCLTTKYPICSICLKFGMPVKIMSIPSSKNESTINTQSVCDTELISKEMQTVFKCKLSTCSKFYHLECLKMWPQTHIIRGNPTLTKWEGNVTTDGNQQPDEKIEILCPSHACHTCASESLQHIQLLKTNIIRCFKCPATFHLNSTCIPAGTEFLTANVILCPRHTEDTKPTNTDWCFLCSGSGNLICCDTCPSSFHLSCLKLQQTPKDKFLCELCQNGCLPLYGDLVWCKFGQFKWWPSIIVPPPIIPKNLNKKNHSRFSFCVRFLGTNDYGWTGRHRVYLYQEDDYTSNGSKDKRLQKAIDEAKVAWDFFQLNKPKNGENHTELTPFPYKKIKNNIPVPPVKLEYNVSELNACNCSPTSESPCGYQSQCLNRVLMIECNPKICPAKQKCENQMFEKREYAPLSIRKTAGKGFGLIATAPISAGTFIIEYVGELIDDIELKRRIEEKQKEKDPHYYFFSIESNLTIDAGPKGNLARFMNHSCEPNCEPQMWTVNGVKRIGLFAKNDIVENTELTFHYNFEVVGDNKIPCHCGTQHCKGYIGGIYNKKNNDSKNTPQEKNVNSSSTIKNNSNSLAKSTKKLVKTLVSKNLGW